MKSARVFLQTIAATGLLGMAWMTDPAPVSSQQPMHSPESNRQVTLGGAQYFVEGEIVKIDGQRFEIKKSDSGERTLLVVNTDTNLDCSAAASRYDETRKDMLASERISAEQQAPAASERQRDQGQRKDETARGAGFRIGQCDFQPGDRVKAEVDDMGRVTTLEYLAEAPPTARRAIGESAGMGELAIPGRQNKPGQLDMTGAGGSIPKEYAVLPVPVGDIKTTGSNILLSRPVKDLQGNQLGTMEKLIVDTHSGQIEYAVIALEDGTHLHPVPWSAIQVKQDERGGLASTIDTSKYQIMPSLMREDSMDLSPSVKKLVKEMQILREREPRKSRDRVFEQRAAAGPMGEEKTGGLAPSGARALPPEKDSPGYEREKEKRD